MKIRHWDFHWKFIDAFFNFCLDQNYEGLDEKLPTDHDGSIAYFIWNFTKFQTNLTCHKKELKMSCISVFEMRSPLLDTLQNHNFTYQLSKIRRKDMWSTLYQCLIFRWLIKENNLLIMLYVWRLDLHYNSHKVPLCIQNSLVFSISSLCGNGMRLWKL